MKASFTLAQLMLAAGLFGTSQLFGAANESNRDAGKYYQSAIAKKNQGDFDGALADFNNAIKLKPDYVEAFIGRGSAKYKKHDPEGALVDYEQAAKIKPELVEIPNRSGDTNKSSDSILLRPEAAKTAAQVLLLLDSKDYDQLAGLADKLRTSKDRYADGRWKLEDIYNGLVPKRMAPDEEWEKRLTALGRWSVSRPDSITARVAWANAIVQYAWKARGTGLADKVTEEGWQLFFKRLAEAAKVLKEAKALKEKCPFYWEVVLWADLGLQANKSRFNLDFDEAIKFEPDFVHFYTSRATYLLPRWYGSENEWHSDLINAADKIGGENGDLLYAQVLWHMHQRYNQITIEDDPQSRARSDKGFEVIEKRFPNSLAAKIEQAHLPFDAKYAKAVVFNQSGKAKHQKGDLAGAIADYNKAIETLPNNAIAYGNRGNLKRDKGDVEGALADYAKALELKPDHGMAYYNRGKLKQTKGDLVGAMADFNKAIELQPDFAFGYYARASLKQANRDYDGAIADFSKTISLKPTYADAYTARGNLKQYKGDKAGAAEDLNKAANLKAGGQ